MAELQRALVEKWDFLSSIFLAPALSMAADTFVLRPAGVHRVGAVATNEPAVLVGDHRSELDPNHAVRAANDQFRVGRRAVRH